MFHKFKYEERLAMWHDFRNSIDSSENPIQDTLEYYNTAPRVSINTDPWDNATWPDPWELVYENQYCRFCILLGICYTLQLSTHFSGSVFEIYIGVDKQKSKTLYYLCIDKNYVIDPDMLSVFDTTLLDAIHAEKVYIMPTLN